MQIKFNKLVLITFVLSGTLLGLILASLYSATQHNREASRWVEHTHEVLQVVGGLERDALQLDFAQKGILLSSNAAVEQRAKAIDRLQSGVTTLLALTKDNVRQQEQARSLIKEIETRVRIAFRNEEEMKRTQDQPSSVHMNEAMEAMATVRTRIEEISQEEHRLLILRKSAEETFQNSIVTMLGIACVVATLLLLISYAVFHRQASTQRRAENRFRHLAQALPVSLWQMRTGTDGVEKFEFISENAPQIRNIDVAAVEKTHGAAFEAIFADDRPQVMEAMRQARETISTYDVEYRVPLRDGTLRWVKSSAKLRRENDGTIFWNGYWADVNQEHTLKDELARATERANNANLAKSAFLAAMSHEIRTPMNGVLGLLELLSLTKLDADQHSTLSVVRSSGRSLLRIVDDILDFSKIEANRMELHPEPFSVANLLQSTCHLHTSMATGKGLMLHTRIDPKISGSHFLDGLRLGQILNNLISNALKFTQRGSVTVSVDLIGRTAGLEELRITVADTGIGLSEQEMKRLFQPFVQAGSETASRFGGTGLGLVISRRLAVLMGGSVKMQSTVGVGTTMSFSCSFPVAEQKFMAGTTGAFARSELTTFVASRRPAPDVLQAERDGTLILVADDHPTNRLVITLQLRSLGYASESTSDGHEAFEAWKTGRFGLLIADCNMPVMNGYELAAAIRSNESETGKRRTPILACTANAMESEVEICKSAGMDEIVVKPASLQVLGHWLQLLLPLAADLDHDADAEVGREEATIINQNLLVEVSGGDMVISAEILSAFRHANLLDTSMLRISNQNQDMEKVAHYAHRIRGACMMLGSLQLAEVCRRIEEAARGSGREELSADFDAFEVEMKRLMAHLDTIAARGQIAADATSSDPSIYGTTTSGDAPAMH